MNSHNIRNIHPIDDDSELDDDFSEDYSDNEGSGD